MPKNSHPWSPAKATEQINRKANDEAFGIAWTDHAKTQIQVRNILMGDVLHVLKKGFVFDEAQQGNEKYTYKYRVESTTPNSKRTVRVVVIPQPNPAVVIVTVMWADEP